MNFFWVDWNCTGLALRFFIGIDQTELGLGLFKKKLKI